MLIRPWRAQIEMHEMTLETEPTTACLFLRHQTLSFHRHTSETNLLHLRMQRSGMSSNSPTEMAFSETFIVEVMTVLEATDREAIERCAVGLGAVRDRGGRLFILGVGGSAGHASHTVTTFERSVGSSLMRPPTTSLS